MDHAFWEERVDKAMQNKFEWKWCSSSKLIKPVKNENGAEVVFAQFHIQGYPEEIVPFRISLWNFPDITLIFLKKSLLKYSCSKWSLHSLKPIGKHLLYVSILLKL